MAVTRNSGHGPVDDDRQRAAIFAEFVFRLAIKIATLLLRGPGARQTGHNEHFRHGCDRTRRNHRVTLGEFHRQRQLARAVSFHSQRRTTRRGVSRQNEKRNGARKLFPQLWRDRDRNLNRARATRSDTRACRPPVRLQPRQSAPVPNTPGPRFAATVG